MVKLLPVRPASVVPVLMMISLIVMTISVAGSGGAGCGGAQLRADMCYASVASGGAADSGKKTGASCCDMLVTQDETVRPPDGLPDQALSEASLFASPILAVPWKPPRIQAAVPSFRSIWAGLAMAA